MYQSTKTPGKKFGSIFAGKKYDQDHTEDGMHSEGMSKESPEHESKESPDFEAGEQEGAQESEGKERDGSDFETHPVTAEHGKAHKVTIHHDHEAGRHTVMSHHPDGHVHTNVHEHAHKAHDEARQLAAVPPAGKEENDEKDSKWGTPGKAQQSPDSENDGFAMPELS
jgi:hypothetical protein